MSVARFFRYLLGAVIAAILLAVVLPFVGIPSSHFLPPYIVWSKSQKEPGSVTRGTITDKYYDVTENPFNVGGKQYFVDYQFRAKAPATTGTTVAGKWQIFKGTVKVDAGGYNAVSVNVDQTTANNAKAKTILPAFPGQPVRVQYEITYPDVNGILAPEGLSGRSIGAGSNTLSGWLIWLGAALVLGYFVMLLLERFSNTENL